VGSVDEADAAARAGADIVIAQGIEAGGHVRRHTAMLPLLSGVVDAVDVPVLGAGGIADGRAVAAVIVAGASGARIGTRFVATVESGAHDLYKAAIVEAGAGTTEISDAFAVCPLCATSPRARVVRDCIAALGNLDDAVAGETTIGGNVVKIEKGSGLPPGTQASGHIDAMAMYANDSVAVVRDVAPAADVLAELTTAAEALLRRAAEQLTPLGALPRERRIRVVRSAR
jgi:nitronate monooxygenase